jgi:hypothetical protein
MLIGPSCFGRSKQRGQSCILRISDQATFNMVGKDIPVTDRGGP